MGFYYFFQKSLFAENYFAIAVINLTTPGPLYTCLVMTWDGSLVGRARYGKVFWKQCLTCHSGLLQSDHTGRDITLAMPRKTAWIVNAKKCLSRLFLVVLDVGTYVKGLKTRKWHYFLTFSSSLQLPSPT